MRERVNGLIFYVFVTSECNFYLSFSRELLNLQYGLWVNISYRLHTWFLLYFIPGIDFPPLTCPKI